jgi:hypothetical protein
MPSKNKHSSNRFTSLKGAFSSTHATKHFHGNKIKHTDVTTDYPDPSTPQLVAQSSGKNAPFSLSFKDKLLMKYHEDYCGLTEDTDTSTRQYKRPETARFAKAGIHLHSRYTNKKIAQLTNKFNNREKKITKSDSEVKADTILMNTLNREHQKNYEKKFHHEYKPPEHTVHAKKPVDTQHLTHTEPHNIPPSRPVPNTPRAPIPASHPVPHAPVPHIPDHQQHQSNPAMHDPDIIAKRQNSFVVTHTPKFNPPAKFHPIKNNNK